MMLMTVNNCNCNKSLSRLLVVVACALMVVHVPFSCCANGTNNSQFHEFDVVVYESTPGGIMAAVAAGRQGRSVVLLSSTAHIGGMSSGGLGKSDIGDPIVIGGLAHEFFTRNGQYYGQGAPEYNLEPHVARDIFNAMLETGNVTVLINKAVQSAQVEDGKIASLTTIEGDVFKSKIFVDASYEGDLIALAHVPYTVGRESSLKYNESLAGFQGVAKGHEFTVDVNPFFSNGSILPLLTPQPNEKVGDGDSHVQAYNFRLCLTQNTSNMVPFTKPDNYNAQYWELARRLFATIAPVVPSGNLGPLPNGKYDMNNAGPISSDFIGGADFYPDGSNSERKEIWQAHKDYMQGLLWFFSQDQSLNKSVHDEMMKWGYCKDEFVETNYWPPQLYVREGRRMIGDFVFTQTYVEEKRGIEIGNMSIGMGSYNYDMHNALRYACSNPTTCTHFNAPYAWNDGDVETNPGYKYQIPVGVLFPPRSLMTNLLAPVPTSASHVGYGTLRMEPQFMIMGHSAGIIASVAINSSNAAIQDVDMGEVNRLLEADGQILTLNPPKPIPSNCTFQEDTHYNHPSNVEVNGQTPQDCCNACGSYKGCVGTLFRYSDGAMYAPSCWVMFELENRTSTQGVKACILNNNI
eukprot:m.104578 g.104578  ORF g.104578 m.104578 type:complete len:633 (+) comp9112_c0_seq2:65-1963(+)